MSQREAIARAIYMRHWPAPMSLPNDRSSPVWENASSEVKEWVLESADAAMAALDDYRRDPVEEKRNDEG